MTSIKKVKYLMSLIMAPCTTDYWGLTLVRSTHHPASLFLNYPKLSTPINSHHHHHRDIHSGHSHFSTITVIIFLFVITNPSLVCTKPSSLTIYMTLMLPLVGTNSTTTISAIGVTMKISAYASKYLIFDHHLCSKIYHKSII